MAKKDFTVTSKGQSFTVPKGHFVGTSPHVAMRLPTVFKNPDEVRRLSILLGTVLASSYNESAIYRDIVICDKTFSDYAKTGV